MVNIVFITYKNGSRLIVLYSLLVAYKFRDATVS
jgi:hypothetical protein